MKDDVEAEVAAIVAWLRAEALEGREFAEKHAGPDYGILAAHRALYYEQAAGMIERGDYRTYLERNSKDD